MSIKSYKYRIYTNKATTERLRWVLDHCREPYHAALAKRDERGTSKTYSRCGHKQAMPLWKRTYHCPNTECRFVMDRDEHSAVNILKRFYAWLGPHMEQISMQCADVFTAIEDVNTFRKAA